MNPIRLRPILALLPILLAAPLAWAGDATTDPASCPLHAQHAKASEVQDGHAHAASPQAPKRASARPAELGQGAFAALSEMVELLEADPDTDWSAVRLDRLREHLIDMDLVMTRADVAVDDLADGFTATVTSSDPRISAAILRMIPAHSGLMNGHRGWRIEVETLADEGAVVHARSDDPSEAARLRALGLAGFLVAGSHHGPHHLAMASGGGH